MASDKNGLLSPSSLTMAQSGRGHLLQGWSEGEVKERLWVPLPTLGKLEVGMEIPLQHFPEDLIENRLQIRYARCLTRATGI